MKSQDVYKITNAEYTLASLEIYQGNPLIEALPNFLDYSRNNIGWKLESVPQDCHADMPSLHRAQWLSLLHRRFFVPLRRHLELFMLVDLMLRQGYWHRNPRPPAGSEYLREAPERFKNAESGGTLWGEALSTCIVGCSGTGKTRGIAQVLSLYQGAIRHKALWTGEPLLQIVFVRVECPHDGSVKALCSSIIEEISRIAHLDYAREYVRPRATLESLKLALVRLMSIHRVGLLVLDEMQNLVNSRKNREDLFNFIVSLSNSLGVPLLFIGTPKLKRFMQTNLRTARRFASLGSFNWERIEKDSRDWSNFTRLLWKTVQLRDVPEEMPEEIQDTLYDLSQGVIDFVTKLLILSELRVLAICVGTERPEILTTKHIRQVYEDHFTHVKPIVDALRANDEAKIESYEDITLSTEHFEQSVEDCINAIAAKETADMPERRKSKALMHYMQALELLGIEATPRLKQVVEEIFAATPNIQPMEALQQAVEKVRNEDDEAGEARRTLEADDKPLPVGSIGAIQ